MKPISDEKREMTAEAELRGEKEEDIALWLKVSKASVGTLWRNFRRRGSFLPIKHKCRPSRVTEAETEAMRRAVKQAQDITLSELTEKLSLPLKKPQLSRLRQDRAPCSNKNAPP